MRGGHPGVPLPCGSPRGITASIGTATRRGVVEGTVARVSERRKSDRRKKQRRVTKKGAPMERRAEEDRRQDDAERRQDPRRKEARVLTTLRVDYRAEDNFLFAYATNVSSLGIFIQTMEPSEPGTELELSFGGVDGGG